MRRVLIMVLLLALASACKSRFIPAPDEQPPDMALTHVTMRQYKGSAVSMQAQAPLMSFYREGPKAGHLEASHVVIDTAQGLHVEADTIAGNGLVGALEGTDVHARTSAGTHVESPRASFDRSQGVSGTAATDAGVRVIHPEFTLEAAAATMDLEAEHAELEHVTTRLQ